MPDDSIHFSWGNGPYASNWSPREKTMAGLAGILKAVMPSKKGTAGCITAAVFEHESRSKINALLIDVWMGDLDSHIPAAELVARLDATGLEYILHTTASHGLTTSVVKLREFEAFKAAKLATGWTGTDEQVAEAWLVEAKRHHHSLIPAAGVTIRPTVVKRPIKDRVTKERVEQTEPAIEITHNPVNKYRVVFRLSKAWRRDDYATISEATKGWEIGCLSVIDWTGLIFDEACKTTDRFYYITAIADEARRARARLIHKPGNALDIWSLPAPKERVAKPGRYKNGVLTMGKGLAEPEEAVWTDPKTGEVFDVLAWWRGRGRRFRFADALAARGVAVEEDRPNGVGKLHVVCPFEDEHSPSAGGYFARNAMADAERMAGGGYGEIATMEGWTGAGAHCNHNHCQGRHVVDFIIKHLDLGELTIEDLLNPEFLMDEGRVNAVDEFDVISMAPAPSELAKLPLRNLLFQKHQEIGYVADKWLADPAFKAELEQALGLEDGKRGWAEMVNDAASTKSGDRVTWVTSWASTTLTRDRHLLRESAVADVLWWIQDEDGLDAGPSYGQLKESMKSARIANTKDWNSEVESKAKTRANKATKVATAEDNQTGIGDEDIPACVTEINKEWFFTMISGEGVYGREYVDPLSGRFVLEYSDKRSFNSFWEDRTHLQITNDGVRVSTWAETWHISQHRRRYSYGVKFAPGATTVPEGVYNLWRGWGVEPKPGKWPLWKAHIRDVLCAGNEESTNWLLCWLARMFQEPMKNGETCVVLRGKEGVGKSTLAKVLKKIIGNHVCTVSNKQHVVGNFNAHLQNALLLNCEEAFFAGDKAAANALKYLINGETLRIEPKGVGSFEVENILHTLMSSNEDWAVPAGIDSRRYAVFDVVDLHKNDKPYFDALHAELDNGGYEAFFYDMLSLDISGFCPYTAILTDGLVDQRVQTLSGIDKFWFDHLCKPVSDNPLGANCYSYDIQIDQFYELYREWRRDQRSEYRLEGRKEFRARIKALCGGWEPKQREWVDEDGKRHTRRVVQLPTREEARASFEKIINSGKPYDWADIEFLAEGEGSEK